jgi:hypothetical protein
VRIRLADVEPAPDVFAAVMATGILSIAASKHHYAEISESLGSLAAVGLVVLIALVSLTGAAKRWDLTDPDVTIRLFTFVAACAVLDSRLTTPRAVVVTLGVVALLSWLVLIGLTARDMTARGWSASRDIAHGAWELASVGTSGLAIVVTKVGGATRPGRLRARYLDPDGRPGNCDAGRRQHPRLGSRLAGPAGARGHRRDLGGGHPVDAAVGVFRLAPDQPRAFFWDALAAWLIVVGAGLLRAGLPWRV